MEVGARPRSILDQTIEGRSTDLFFFFYSIQGKDRKVPYRDNRHSQRILRAPGIPLPSVRLSRGWREQNNRERPGRPAQGSRASFI